MMVVGSVVDGGSVVAVVVVVDGGSVVVVVGVGTVEVVAGGCALPAVLIVDVVVVVLVVVGRAAVGLRFVPDPGLGSITVVGTGAAAEAAVGVVKLTSSRSGDPELTDGALSCQGSAHDRAVDRNGATFEADGVAIEKSGGEDARGSIDALRASLAGNATL